MLKRRQIKLLLADDDKPIVNIYKVGLPRYFVSDDECRVDDLEDELFGERSNAGTAVSIEVCSQGAAAVQLVREAIECGEPFDVVILDIRMPPGIDGVEAAQRIRELDETVPIIFVSGYSDYTRSTLQRRVLATGPMGYLEKPVQLAQLAEKISEVATR